MSRSAIHLTASFRSLALVAALVALGLVGCEEETTAGRTNTRGPAAASSRAPTKRTPSTPVGAFSQRDRPPSFPSASRRGEGGPSRPSAPSVGAGEAADPASSEREDPSEALERNLVEAFGDPASCLSEEARDAAGETLRLQITVRVTASGRPVNATVSGGGLPEADLDCLRTRAESLRLRGPIPDAPRTVSTSVEYRVRDTRTSRTERTPADPGLHPGTLRADRTLDPAGTETERPGGFVAPSSTLPATNEAAQAPGYVPPGSTLPALAPPVP